MSRPRMLAACEYSGRVRDAFAALGWDAWSCDLLPSDAPGQHFQGDVRVMLEQSWDLMVAFPPCTYLCSSGMHWTVRGLRDPKLTEDALDFVHLLLAAPIKHIALENPVGAISTRIRKPDCSFNPWQFGEDASKKPVYGSKTCPLSFRPTCFHCHQAGGGQISAHPARTSSAQVPTAGRSGHRPTPAWPWRWLRSGARSRCLRK